MNSNGGSRTALANNVMDPVVLGVMTSSAEIRLVMVARQNTISETGAAQI